MNTRRFCILVLAIFMLGLAACGKEPRPSRGIMDSPEHHYRSGMHFLDKKEPVRAIQEFNKALELDPEYGPALAGKGLARAMQGDEEALDTVEEGEDEAANPEEELRALVARIRALTVLAAENRMDPEDLVDESEDAFDDAMDIIEDHPRLETPELYFYQGEVYIQALRLERAEEMYRRVLDLGKGMQERAKARWKLAQKVRRAAPETHVGVEIALVDRISRADMAALLVEELGFERFFSRTPASVDTAFKAPDTPAEAWRKEQAIQGGRMTDVPGHPLSSDIEIVTRYGIRGLAPFPDGTFRPDQELSRAEVAMILEDVYVRAANDPGLATRYIGQTSPFDDLRPDHPAFNAAMLTTTRGLLESGVRSGSFEPMAPVAGVDALLAVKRLKEELQVF